MAEGGPEGAEREAQPLRGLLARPAANCGDHFSAEWRPEPGRLSLDCLVALHLIENRCGRKLKNTYLGRQREGWRAPGEAGAVGSSLRTPGGQINHPGIAAARREKFPGKEEPEAEREPGLIG